jgi:cyclic beta-1,2-glucan synthetase
MYRAGIESILGFNLRGDRLQIDPCIPHHWPGFEIVFRYRSARYVIMVDNSSGAGRGLSRIEVDSTPLTDIAGGIPLQDDGATRRVRIVLG